MFEIVGTTNNVSLFTNLSHEINILIQIFGFNLILLEFIMK